MASAAWKEDLIPEIIKHLPERYREKPVWAQVRHGLRGCSQIALEALLEGFEAKERVITDLKGEGQ